MHDGRALPLRARGHGAWLLVVLLGALAPGPALAELRVVTTTPALADLTRQVGGERVSVEPLMRGPENPHNVIPKPSFVVKLRKARFFVHLGLDAEPWVPPLVRSARREHLLPGNPGDVDAARGIALLEVPAREALSRAFGDIHVYGNTHYLLDPMNGLVVARTLTDALVQADPAHAAEFEANFSALEMRIRALTDRLVRELAPHAGTGVVTYHRTWPYFLNRFRLRKLGEVEPKPGIAPGAQHISKLAAQMRVEGVGIVVVETFSNHKIAQRLAERANGRAVLLAQEVNALPGVDSYETLFEHNVGALIAAFRELTP